MENQKQTQKQEQIQKQEFVKRSELSVTEIGKLQKFNVSFTENEKRNIASFVIELVKGKCQLNTNYSNRITIDWNTWNLIKIKAKQKSSFVRPLPVRFSIGVGSNNKVYHLWELFITDTINYSGFLTKNDLELIDILVENGQMQPIVWEDAGVVEEADLTGGLL